MSISRAFLLAAGTCVLAIASGPAAAQGAASACLLPPAFSATAPVAFAQDPSALLSRHPLGGVAMTREVRAIVGSDITTLGAMMELARDASPAQRGAIGAGLAQAAQACLAADALEAAEQIQLAIALSGLEEVIVAFNAVTGGTLTAAIGPGAGPGAGPGVGGPATRGVAGIGGGSGGTPGSQGRGSNVTGSPGAPGFSGGGGGSVSTAARTGVTPPASVIVNLPPPVVIVVPSPTRP